MRPASFNGICTRRPSAVTAMATWRRFLAIEQTHSGLPNAARQTRAVCAVYEALGDHATTRTPRQCSCPHEASARARAGPPATGRISPAFRARCDETAGRPAASSRDPIPHDVGGHIFQRCPASSTSAELARADTTTSRLERPEPSASESSGQYQRRPAPIVRASDATSARAHVRRTRLPFTFDSFRVCRVSSSPWQPGGLPEKIPGFASPPHDGFALDSETGGGALALGTDDGPFVPRRNTGRRSGSDRGGWGSCRGHRAERGPTRTRPVQAAGAPGGTRRRGRPRASRRRAGRTPRPRAGHRRR